MLILPLTLGKRQGGNDCSPMAGEVTEAERSEITKGHTLTSGRASDCKASAFSAPQCCPPSKHRLVLKGMDFGRTDPKSLTRNITLGT